MLSPHQLITQAGLRPTKTRLAVLQVISEAKCALNHPEILEKLHKVDRVTIYRVLDWLTENQLIHKISGDNRAWKFQLSHSTSYNDALNTAENNNHQHAHLHCENCGKVLCLHEIFPVLPQAVIQQYQIHQIEINLKGTCQECITAQ